MDLHPHVLHVAYCPLREVTHHTYFVEVQKTTAAANNREEIRFSLFKQNLCCSNSKVKKHRGVQMM